MTAIRVGLREQKKRGNRVGYKKIEPVLTHIDSISQECGLFTRGNGGYGCKSKSKDKQEPGCCYAFDCPLAYEADIDDLKRHDQILYAEYKKDEESLHNWMVQYREVARREARNE